MSSARSERLLAVAAGGRTAFQLPLAAVADADGRTSGGSAA